MKLPSVVAAVLAGLIAASLVSAQPISFRDGADRQAVTHGKPLPVYLGAVPGNVKYGFVPALAAADNAADVWAIADNGAAPLTKTFLSAAASLYVSSDDTDDADVDVTLIYLDADGAEQTVVVNTNAGFAFVDSGITALDCSRAYVSGDTAPEGNLYISADNTDAGGDGIPDDVNDVLCYIPFTYNQSQQASFMVPAGYQAHIYRVVVTTARDSGAAGSANLSLRITPSGGVPLVKRVFYGTTASVIDKADGLIAPSLSTVVLRCDDVSEATADSNITGEIHYVLVPNP